MIERLEGGHVATLLKVHHAIFDGVSGMQLAAAVYDVEPVPPEPSPASSPQACGASSTLGLGRRARST